MKETCQHLLFDAPPVPDLTMKTKAVISSCILSAQSASSFMALGVHQQSKCGQKRLKAVICHSLYHSWHFFDRQNAKEKILSHTHFLKHAYPV